MNLTLRSIFVISLLLFLTIQSYPQGNYSGKNDDTKTMQPFRFIKSEAGGYVKPLALHNRILVGYETGFFPTMLLFYDLNYNFSNTVEAGVQLGFNDADGFGLTEINGMLKTCIFDLGESFPLFGYFKLRASSDKILKDYDGDSKEIIRVVNPHADNGTDFKLGIIARNGNDFLGINNLFYSVGTDFNYLTGREYEDFKDDQKMGVGVNLNFEQHFLDDNFKLGLENRFYSWLNRGWYFETVPQAEIGLGGLASLILGVAIPIYSGNNYQVYAGLNLPIDFTPAPEPEPEPIVEPIIKEVPKDFDLYVSTVGEFKVEDVKYREYFPLLNYVFFDKNSSALGERYVKMSSSDFGSFKESDLESDQMVIYKNILNIFGNRLKQKPNVNIELIGCNDNTDTEKGNSKLSKSRAETVKDYLVNICGINESRIKVKAQNLPNKPSNLTDPLGMEENRRVEIVIKDESLLSLVDLSKEYKKVEPELMDVKLGHNSTEDIVNWQITAVQSNKTLFEKKFTGDLPTNYEWDLSSAMMNQQLDESDVTLTVKATDEAGKISTPHHSKLKVTYSRLVKHLEKVSLVLFDFNSSEVGSRNRDALMKLKETIRPMSKITINGYTDIIGQEEYNQKLSESRAKSVSTSMQNMFTLSAKNMTVSGLGEKSPIYDNNLPEGRFYNRTCQVTNETLISK
ncbi:MAG: OmpA family protein [Ignavibacteriaceae bacterium]